MPKFIDYTNKQIGRVKVLENVERGMNSRWICLCDCGETFICLKQSFKRGETFECEKCRMERKRGIDLTDRKFGRWNVIERQKDKNNKTVWLVKCDCGKFGLVATNVLGKRGKSLSCGCLGRKEKSIRANTTLYPPKHLTSKTNLYAIRARILQYCYNEKNVQYKNYGAKGIIVCDLWRNGAKDFYQWCIENGWKNNYVVHLKRDANIFSPENCCILTPEEHQRELLSKRITIGDKTLNVYEWSEVTGIPHFTILDRLIKGYSEEEAVFSKRYKNSGKRRDWPDQEIKRLYESGMSLADVGRELGIRYTGISIRLKKMNVKVDNSSKRRKYKSKICVICNQRYQPTSSKQKKCLKC